MSQDIEKAISLYKQSWYLTKRTGECCNLASLYFYKKNNHRQAYFWWDKAIDLGDGEALLEKAKALISLNKNKHASKKVLNLLNRAFENSSSLTEDSKIEVSRLIETSGASD